MTTTVILCKMRAVEEGGLVSLAPNVVHCKDARDGSKTWSCSELASEVSKHPKPLVLSQKETWIFFVSHITCKLHKHFESYDNHHRQEGRQQRYFPREVPSHPPTSPLNTGSSRNGKKFKYLTGPLQILLLPGMQQSAYRSAWLEKLLQLLFPQMWSWIQSPSLSQSPCLFEQGLVLLQKSQSSVVPDPKTKLPRYKKDL